MKITSARFVRSALERAQYPRGPWPEVAFLGRSNVGKSTLLNTLLAKKGLAKTSGTPGKTQTINFFAVNEAFYFVDLPGYGYAKVPKTLKARWNRVMVEYLRDRGPLCMAVALIDARHPPTENDVQMQQILEEAEVPTLVAATKIDKLKRSQRKPSIQRIREAFELDDDALILPFSAITGEGVRELWAVIEEHL